MKLKGEERVRVLLAMIPYFRERQYVGNYYDNDDLNDILYAVERADLTDRQREAVTLIAVYGYTRTEAANRLGISRQSISKYETRGVELITEEYEREIRNESNGD